jgi:hypothetical protein
MKPFPLSLAASGLLGMLTLLAAPTDTELPVLDHLVKRTAWDGGETGGEQGKPAQTTEQTAKDIRFISIHNFAGPKDKETTRLKSNQAGHRERGFGDIAYHFIVGDSGRIYEGRRPTLASASNTYYLSPAELKTKVTSIDEGKISVAPDFRSKARERIPGHTKGHLTVSFLCGGRVENGELVDHPELLQPQAMQRATTLVAELLVRHGLEPKDIRAHRELAETNCPNDAIYRWLRGETMRQEGRGEGMKLIEAEFKRLKGTPR